MNLLSGEINPLLYFVQKKEKFQATTLEQAKLVKINESMLCLHIKFHI